MPLVFQISDDNCRFYYLGIKYFFFEHSEYFRDQYMHQFVLNPTNKQAYHHFKSKFITIHDLVL